MDRLVYKRMAEQDSEHWWFVARRKILHDQIAALRLPRHARVLEVGCGPGGNLAMLAEFGRVDAMELDEDARRIASLRTGFEVRSGALPDEIPYSGEQFDLIAAFDVIEHVERDADSVRAIARHLKPGGTLIVTVPAYQWLWSEHDTRHHHHRRYTRAMVREIVVSAGLSIKKCSYFNTILFPLVVLIRSLKKPAGTGHQSDDVMPGKLVNSLLEHVFAAERFILRVVSLPFGVSVLCVASRD